MKKWSAYIPQHDWKSKADKAPQAYSLHICLLKQWALSIIYQMNVGCSCPASQKINLSIINLSIVVYWTRAIELIIWSSGSLNIFCFFENQKEPLFLIQNLYFLPKPILAYSISTGDRNKNQFWVTLPCSGFMLFVTAWRDRDIPLWVQEHVNHWGTESSSGTAEGIPSKWSYLRLSLFVIPHKEL